MLDQSGKPVYNPARKGFSAEAENELRQKVQVLQREFAEIDVNQDRVVTREELFSYLDRKNGRQFDRAIAEDIYSQMDRDHDGRVTIAEFIKVYIEADEILRTKVDKARLAKEAFRNDEEDYNAKAQKAAADEGYGAGGVAKNGIAHVGIQEARLHPLPQLPRNPNLFVDVYLDRLMVAKTKIIAGSAQGWIWDQKFSFEIKDTRSELRFVLYDRNMLTGGDVLGQAVVMLSDLGDQEVHQVLVNLIGRDEQTIIGQLGLELQWIYSKAKYFRDQARKARDDYLRAEEDVRDYEMMLQKLHEPFRGLEVVSKTQSIHNKYPGLSATDQKFVYGMNKLADRFGKGEGGRSFWEWLGIIIALVELVVGVLIMFGRSSFFDILCSIIVLLYVRQGSLREFVSLRIISFAILASVVFDIVAILLFWGKWSTEEVMGMEASIGLKGVVLILTFISIVLKVILAALCYMLNIETSQQRGSAKRSVMRNVDTTSPERNPNPNYFS